MTSEDNPLSARFTPVPRKEMEHNMFKNTERGAGIFRRRNTLFSYIYGDDICGNDDG